MELETTKVGIDVSVVEELAAHIRAGTTDMVDSELRIPREHFVSGKRAQEELALFRELPLAAAHLSELPNPGDFVTREVGGVSVIITHGDDGVIRSYRNMCAHRGGRVEQKPAGRKRIFMCQYHGWSFDAKDGGLRKLSYEDTFGPIDYSCTGLTPIHTEVRYGLIFLTFDGDAAKPLDSYFGPEIDAQLDPWNLPESAIFLDETFQIPINWKLVVDGALDSLHAQYLHPGPGNVGARTLTNVAVFRKFGQHGRLFAPRNRLKRIVDSGEPLVASSDLVASIMLLYPNTLIAAAPDHIELWTVWPSANPAESEVRIRFFVRPSIMTEEMEQRVLKSWDILRNAATNEDWPMETWIQQNAANFPDGVFRYGRNEVSAQHLHHVLSADLAARGDKGD
jgi:phenylpropionate dioxygenase-like ring-hydroxylating dioxygenase large terminal subunit